MIQHYEYFLYSLQQTYAVHCSLQPPHSPAHEAPRHSAHPTLCLLPLPSSHSITLHQDSYHRRCHQPRPTPHQHPCHNNSSQQPARAAMPARGSDCQSERSRRVYPAAILTNLPRLPLEQGTLSRHNSKRLCVLGYSIMYICIVCARNYCISPYQFQQSPN